MSDEPLGVTKPAKTSVPTFYVGDSITLQIATGKYRGQNPSPDVCRVRFTLKVDRYHDDPVFEAGWMTGVGVAAVPGVVRVHIPGTVTATLFSGSYEYAVTATDNVGNHPQTLNVGSFRLDLSPGSAHNQTPYEDL